MSYEEAIKILEAIRPTLADGWKHTAEEKTEAIDLAIKALKKPAGHWITKKGSPDIIAPTGKYYECSECGFVTAYGAPRYCMKCGAEMEKGAET